MSSRVGPPYHNPNEVLLGTTRSADRVVSNYDADPADFPAGTVVSKIANGSIEKGNANGAAIGVSAGKSMSQIERLAVIRSGLLVPILLKDEGVIAELEKGDLTFISKIPGEAGNDISIVFLDELSDASASVEEVDGLKIVVHMENNATTATALKTAIDADPEASALIEVVIADGQGAEPQAAFAEDNLEDGADSYPYAVKGAVVEIDETLGVAESDGDYTSNAHYASEAIDGVYPDGTIAKVALVDMGGGL